METEVGNFHAKRLILATGGCAAPKTGSDGSGFILARQLGHTIVSPVPALVQLRAEEPFFKSISGVRTQARVTILIDGKPAASDRGEVQLTDYGISGIPVFQVSRYASRACRERRRVQAVLDFLPEYSMKEAEALFAQRNREHPRWSGEELLAGILPKKLAVLLAKQGKGHQAQICKNWTITIKDTNGFDQAQVCAGGVSVKEIRPDTCESRLVSGLFFGGEVMDVDGICGGYNLQWAWSTGYLAGRSAAESAGTRRKERK